MSVRAMHLRSICVCMCAHANVSTYVSLDVRRCVRTDACMHACMCICIYVYACEFPHARLCGYMHVCSVEHAMDLMFACMHKLYAREAM